MQNIIQKATEILSIIGEILKSHPRLDKQTEGDYYHYYSYYSVLSGGGAISSPVGIIFKVSPSSAP